MYALTARRQPCVVRERAVDYRSEPASATAALAKIREGLEELAASDLAATGDELGRLLLGVGAVVSQLQAQEARFTETFDRSKSYRRDACVSTHGWLRLQTNLGHGAAKRRLRRAKLLARMPLLREAFERGSVRVEHVDAVLYRAIPSRVAAIADHDETLTRLAETAEPRHVAVAVDRIVDAIDADGADDLKPCEVDHLRNLGLREGFAGLDELSGTTTPLLSELLRRTRDMFDKPDPADTPEEQRRTPGQRFHDALQAALQTALDNHPGGTIGGVKAHVGLFVDLFTLLGADELATIKPRLASGKGITPELARYLIATTNPTMRVILGLGPWQPVSVGRVRALPAALQMASYLGHPHCRGPGCDLPAQQCDDDHIDEYCAGGITALFKSVPLCHPHNDLKHNDRWSVFFDTATGEVTWTSADGSRVITLPPPDI